MLELGWFCASKNKTKKFPQNLNWPHVNCNSYFSITKIQTKIYPLPWLKISVFWINFWNWSDEWRIQRKYCFWIFNCCPTSTRNYVFCELSMNFFRLMRAVSGKHWQYLTMWKFAHFYCSNNLNYILKISVN
jgi:hypothetical protein